MTYQSTVRRLTLVTAILVAIGLTLFLTAPFGKGVSLAQASAENTPATGAPIIASPFWYPAEPRVTRELRALTFYIEDEDGMENVTFAYQWIANDGSTDTDIVGASAQEYTLQASDEGMTIKVRVSFTDDAGNSESRTSEPTVEVVAEDAGICTRTPIVIERIIWYADGVRDCGFVTDDHLADVTSLIFVGSQDGPRIDSFKAGDFAGLSNLTFLSIWATDLTELPTGVFNGLSRLRELNMHTNRNLATLPSGIFDGLTLITELHMNHNAIAEFPPGVFEDLEVLRVLNLGGNELTTLPEGVFDNLTHLEELYIWDNGLTTLPEGIFDNLSDLERLSLNNNGLTSLRADLFPGLDKLKDLSFWNNNLDALPDDIFKDLDSLEVLSLSQNNFDALPDGLFSGSTSLVSVWLEDNPGSPFVFDLEVAREDDDTVVVNVSNATPLDISITLEAYGGSLSATEVTLPAGSTSTEAINATPDGDGAMTVRVVSADFEAEYATGIAVGRGGPLTLPNAQNDNNPATGKPTISGTAQVGQTLTASKSDIADPDGVDNATFAYQWVSNDGSTDRDIADATSSTYTITASELGRTIKVLVTFADDGGNHEIATSAATEAVVAAPNIPATGKPVIVGDPIIPPYHSTEALTVDLSGISDQNGMSGAEFSYTWHCVGEDLDDRCPYGNSWEPTYQLSSTLQGHTIKVYVSFMDDGGNVETLVSEPVGPVAHPNSPARGAPLLRGTPIVGKRLSADSLGIHDGNGTQKHRFDRTYQWFADGTEIEGATGYGYTVSSDDVGKRIHFVLYFKDDDGWDEALESPPTALVVAADSENSPPRGAPQIRIRHSSESNGEAHYIEVGDTITTVTTTGYSGTNITDADGLTNAVFTYQWMRGDGTTYSDIPDATSMSYTLGDADEGKGLKVKVTFTDDAGNQHSMFSAPSSPVDPGPTPSNNNPAEGNAVISGTAKVGETLTVDVSGITDADGMEDASFGFTWTDGTYWLGIGYIDTWEVLPSYVGKQLTVHWNFYDDMGYHESGEVTSAVVVATVPEEPRAVAVEPGGTGELDVSWAEPDSDGGSEITSYTVQWKKAAGIWDADEDVPEATATSTTHTITGLELDVEYTVRIIATNSIGDGAASDEVTATTVAAKPNSPATGTPTINGTAQVGETLTADTTGIDDSDGLADVSYNYQWLADDTEIAGATGNAYVLTSAELGKAVRVRVSFTDDAGNEESLTSAATTAVAAAPPPPPDNVRAVTQESGAVELTWEAPQDATVTGYRIERSRADENRGGQRGSDGRPRDNHTLVEDTGSADTGYTDKSAEQGVEHEYRVSARNEAGAGESSDWVRAGPESVSNSPATGAPTIRGTAQVGETLTADISGIADADGLDNVSFSYQWLSSRDTAISGATGETYTLVSTDLGKIIKVKVTFTDGAGNPETRTSAPTGAVLEEPVLGDGLPGAPRSLTATPGNREVTLSWDPPADNGNPPATRYRIEWRIEGKDYDRNHWGTAQETTYTTNDQANLANGVRYVFRVKAGNGSGNSYGPYGPASGEVSATPTSGSAVDLDTPVLSDTETLHHGMVRLDWQDVEDAGWYVVQYYHIEDGEWLDLRAEGVDIAFHGSSAVVSNLHGLSWLRVGAASCDGASEWSQIEELYGTNASDWKGVPVPEVAEGDEIEPCPVVLGTPVLSDTENLHHGMVQLDWQDIEDAGWYVVQYYHLEDGEWLDLPAEGVDIAFHGSSAVVSNLHVLSWLRVGAASCDGASEWSQIEELYGTNASDWKGVPVPEVAEGDEIEPCSEEADTSENSLPTGAPAISGTAQVGETLTANTSGIADADGLSNVQYEYQWLADDSDISGATSLTYTLADTDEGKAIKVKITFTDDEGHEETLTSTATDSVSAAPAANSPATGVPTISGTAQVGETLMANTTGVADADGLSNVQYEYQWLAGDADITGATGLTYTLVAAHEGKAIKVQVDFTDDAGNEESLTSAATDAVAAAPNPNSPATKAYITVVIASGGDTVSWSDPGGCSSDYNIYKAITPSVNDSETSHIHLVSAAPGSTQATLDISHSEDDRRYPRVEVELYCGTYDAASSQNLLISSTQLSIGGTSLVGINIREGTYSSAPLTALTISSGMLSPDFDRGLGRYSAEVPSDVEVITLDPTVLTGYQTDFVKNPSLYTVTVCRTPQRAYCFYSYGDGTTTGIVLSDADTDTEGFQINLGRGENRLGIGVHKGPVAAGPAKKYLLTITRAANTPATGQPTINGTAQVGEVLEVDTSGIADADGLANVTFSYQWLSSRDTEIGGATSSTYTLQASDESKAVKVQVSFTDDAGNDESLTSAATHAVAAASAANSPATGAPTISGTAQVGETLTANTSAIADADGLGSVQYEYQWLADDSDIAGATNATYTLAAADEGKAIKVQVNFADDAGNEETLTSAATDAVAAAQTNSPATGAPTITGTVQVGETLTANTSGIADADGLSNVQYEYQWLADDPEINGATGATYALVDADEGKAIKVRVSFTDDAGNEETLTSAATDAVSAAPTTNSPATGVPTISGTVQVGETLTANTSEVADADGLGNVQYEYQWLADDAAIADAIGSSYTLFAADEGRVIKVQVSFTDDAGNEETLTSAATDAVAAEPTEPPDKPKGLDATASHGQVVLTWNDPEDESITGYVILRRVRVNDQGGDFSVLVANTGSATTTYTDSEVAASTTYTYRIKAINEHGVSERSSWVHIDTPAPPVPDKPTGLEAAASNGQVVLTWDDPEDESITGYVILRRVRVNDTGGDFSVLVANTGSAATTYTDNEVAASTTYTYRIKAINEHGTSERSRWVHIDTPAAP